MTARRIRSLRSHPFPCWPVRLFVALFSLLNVQSSEIAKQENCFAICVSRCFNSSRGLQICGRKCDDYRSETLCKSDACWQRCNDLLSDDDLKEDLSRLDAPFNLSVVYNQDSNIDLAWSTDLNNTIYAVQFKRQSDQHWHAPDQLLAEDHFLRNFSMNRVDICEELEFRVAAISPVNGFGRFSEPYSIPVPRPNISSELKLMGLHFRPVPYQDPNSSSNGTLTITLGYNETAWPLGSRDLEVIPLFHVVKCAVTYEGILANPIFYRGDMPNTIEAQTSADFMYYKCTVFYFINEVRSKQCNRSFKPINRQNLGLYGMHPLEINCETVANSGCANPNVSKHPKPECGFSSNFAFQLLDEQNIDWSNPRANISVNVTFNPIVRKTSPKPLYHVAFYGKATQFLNPQEELLAGVNITSEIIGNASSCELIKNGQCKRKHDNSLVLTNLSMDTLYGVVICGVLDPKNLTFPKLTGFSQGLSPRAERIFITSESHKTSTSVLIYLLVGGFSFGLVLVFFAGAVYHLHKKQNENLKLKTELQHSHTKVELRYTNLPRVHDIWELERRNLIIYDDKKLGSGAFGAVFLGKLIGKANGSQDAKSTLSVNLMRAENCKVAVKMLPQYADELCKSDFLREIALMKTLGYHERLVNMLACITDSEPYCLIVEYCSDSDLLQFLGARCKYMMQLDSQQINYTDPTCGADFDADMIMTTKQLLMFAVQISFGLEYLSQKGFVHRDVAARNVLVHDKHYAKIGDFGLCRFIYANEGNYKSRGGRLPVKWMAPESIRDYEFTTKSDVWSFGVCLFEIITLGGCPYPGIQVDDMLRFLDSGKRMEQPDNCSDEFYSIMNECWSAQPASRPSFCDIRKKLAKQLESITEEYSYLKLDAQKEYYMLNTSTDSLSKMTSFDRSQLAVAEHSSGPSSDGVLLKP